jgi:hypothetical protein
MTSNRNFTPKDCPKFDKCNAPLCPLDQDLYKRVMQGDEAVCFYLTEAVKVDAEAVFRSRGREELFKVMSESIQPMSMRWARIRLSLDRSRKTGSRMARIAPWEVDRGV